MSNNFSREEISKIMSKASQIQAQMDKYGDHEMLSEEEILELGTEVGISKTAILEAMHQVDSKENPAKRFSWLSGTSSLHESRMLPGKLTEKEWDSIIAEIRASTGGIGKLITTNSTFEWEQRRAEMGYRHITFIPGEHSTKFTYNYNWRGLNIILSSMPTVLGMALGVIIGKTVFGNEYKGIAMLIGLFSGFAGGRMYLYSYFKDQRQRLDDLTKSVSGILKRKKTSEPLLDKIPEDEPARKIDVGIESSRHLES